jgi:16S rRNA (adenine1518-N6/adenine1519-N6)-dimethyltransferase
VNGTEPPATDLPSPGDLLRRFGVSAKKGLGQHFLTDPHILGRIATAAGAADGDLVLEIGPGPGGLTRTLLARGCRVVAVELDVRAVAHLRTALPSPRLTVVEGDALALDLAELLPGPAVATGNLPYNIATEIFFKLEAIPTISRMALMFQREVADRFVAGVGDKPYGPLALLSALRWRRSLAVKLPPGAFIPRPKVHSAVVLFERLPQPAVPAALEPAVRRLVRLAFQQRRKTLRNALAAAVRPEDFERTGLDPGLRPERLTLADFVRLARERESETAT